MRAKRIEGASNNQNRLICRCSCLLLLVRQALVLKPQRQFHCPITDEELRSRDRVKRVYLTVMHSGATAELIILSF